MMEYTKVVEFLNLNKKTHEDMNKIWDRMCIENPLIEKLNKCGKKWYDLTEHLMKDLITRYSKVLIADELGIHVMYNTILSTTERLIYLAMRTQVDNETGLCTINRIEFSKRIGISTHTLRASLNNLSAENFILGCEDKYVYELLK